MALGDVKKAKTMDTIKIKKAFLKFIFETLSKSHRIIGPKIENDVLILTETGFEDIPSGYKDRQKPGSYKISKENENDIFSFSIGPDSFKRFFHPPMKELFNFKKTKKAISLTPVLKNEKPLALIGVRACDISAIKLYDRVFLEGVVRDSNYESLRKDALIIGVNCLYPGDNCFCSSMGTGPEIKDNFDIAITELKDCFLMEIGSVAGKKIIEGLPSDRVEESDMNEKASVIENCRRLIKKSVRAEELPWLIYKNLEHPRWSDIARRDLECGNCTQVCPTCFCNSSYDYLQLSGVANKSSEISGVRVMKWDSCFSRNFARVHGGNFRPSRRARFRQWMSHKLAYTFEQFGLTGCVGCGRCITWCPAGIDITQELEALRSVR